MVRDIQSLCFKEIDDQHNDFRGAKAGQNLAWKFFLIVISTAIITLASLIALIAATILVQCCIATGRISIVAVALVFLTQGAILFSITTLGISRVYIVPLLSVFVISLLLYLFNTAPGFDVTTFSLSLSIGTIFSCLGVITIAQCIAFTLLACTLRGCLIALLTSSLISTGLVWVAVDTAQTKVAGNFAFTVILFLGIVITAFITSQRMLEREGRWSWVRPKATFWAAIGGTSFKGLDLSRLDFTGAKIAHTDFRARKFYRTCLREVKGLDLARVDNQYFDLDLPKVQELLTVGSSKASDFSRVNLCGAYLRGADLRRCNLSEVNLDGADLRGADLRDSILVRSILTNADLSQADLTGACIKDWSFNQQTVLTGVKCDYVYREFENNQPTDRYPSDRDFQPGEFESLFQKLTNAVELVFQDQIDWRALSFTFEKFRLEDDGMGLELKGIEQRGNYWIVKVTHGEGVSKQQVEQQVQSTYEDLRSIMEAKDKQINRLLGIVETQTEAMQRQAEALTNFSQQPFGNHFLISGSTITNLAGSGQIEYREAAHGVRSLITNQIDPNSNLQELLGQLKHQNVATTSATQRDLIQQVLFSEADRDPALKQFLLEKGQHILDRLPDGEFKIAIRNAISLIRND